MRQQEIEFDRVARLRLVEQLELPAPSNWLTSPQSMMTVLREIDTLCGNREAWRSTSAEIARRVNCHRSAVTRALRGLRTLGVVETTRTKRGNLLSIDWARVRDYVLMQQQPGTKPPPEAGGCEMAHNADQEGAEEGVEWRTVRQRDGAPCAIGMAQDAPLNTPPVLPPELPPSTTNTKRAATSKPAAPTTPDAWAAVAAALGSIGLVARRKAVQTARRNGIPPDEVLSAIDHYRSRSAGFAGPGAILFWIGNAYAGQPPHQGWPQETAVPPPRTVDPNVLRDRIIHRVTRNYRRPRPDMTTDEIVADRQCAIQAALAEAGFKTEEAFATAGAHPPTPLGARHHGNCE